MIGVVANKTCRQLAFLLVFLLIISGIGYSGGLSSRISCGLTKDIDEFVSKAQLGDILLVAHPGFLPGRSWDHAAIVTDHNEVTEAHVFEEYDEDNDGILDGGVGNTTICQFIKRYDEQYPWWGIVLLRVKRKNLFWGYASPKQVDKAVAFAKEIDSDPTIDFRNPLDRENIKVRDTKYYCSQLVWAAYKHAGVRLHFYAGTPGALYDYHTQEIARIKSSLEKLTIVSPTQGHPANAGPKGNPRTIKIVVELRGIETINIDGFQVFIGGKESTVHVFPDSSVAILLVYSPKQDAAAGFYDLEVRYQDLSAKEPQAVRYTSLTDPGNVSAVLVIDRTGSMEGAKIELALSAATIFASLMRIGDEIGVVSYSTDLPNKATAEFPLREITSEADNTAAQKAISRISTGGWTSIGAGLQEGQNQLNMANLEQPHAMVLLSDGLENRAPWVADVLPTIPEKTDIYTIPFGADADKALMHEIAVRTRGWYYDSYKPQHLLDIYNRIWAQLTGHQTLLSKLGTITTGSIDEIESLIDSTIQKLIFMLGWSGSDLNLTLVTPDGSIIDQGVATIDPNVVYRSGPTFKFYEITSPISGEWELRIEGVDVPPEGEEYTATVMGIASLALEAFFNKDYYIPNEPITILASLLEEGSPVTNATVKVEISKPDGSISTFTLFDDGLHDDSFADDGIYGNTYTETSEKGSYTFDFQASGNTSFGEPFNRSICRYLFLGKPIGTISGEILYEGKQQGEVYIQAWADDPTMSGDPDYQAVINQPGAYILESLPDGTYYLAAYLDCNGNGRLDGKEPNDITLGLSPPEPVILTNGEVITNVYIVLYEVPLLAIAHCVEDCPQGVEVPGKIICLKEIEWASWLYLNGQEVPGTGGEKIDLKSLREMVTYYMTQTPIDQPSPQASSQEVTAQMESLLGVEKVEELKVKEVKNVPNPVTGANTTKFIVEGQGIKEIAVQIFDLSGRRVFDSGEVTGSTFEWYLLNDDGQIVANGVYLYIVTVEGFNGDLIRNAVKKMVILR